MQLFPGFCLLEASDCHLIDANPARCEHDKQSGPRRKRTGLNFDFTVYHYRISQGGYAVGIPTYGTLDRQAAAAAARRRVFMLQITYATILVG